MRNIIKKIKKQTGCKSKPSSSYHSYTISIGNTSEMEILNKQRINQKTCLSRKKAVFCIGQSIRVIILRRRLT